jgi:hypothetical protein
MSDENEMIDPYRQLTRRELRAMQREEAAAPANEFVAATEPSNGSDAAQSPTFETVAPATPEPAVEAPVAPAAPTYNPSFEGGFKFVAKSATDTPAETSPTAPAPGFEAPYRYVPGGASATANQNSLPEVPVASPTYRPYTSPTVPPVTPVAPASNTGPIEIVPPSVQAPSFFAQPMNGAGSSTAAPIADATPTGPSHLAAPVLEPEEPAEVEGLFNIPTSLTGDVATASIVIENPTNPLDLLANATGPITSSIPVARTGSINIQNPETRSTPTFSATGSIRTATGPIGTTPSTDTASNAIITPLKSQTIAISGELGHQRGVRFKPVDTQKYWVLGIGVAMALVGVGLLASFMFGYLK